MTWTVRPCRSADTSAAAEVLRAAAPFLVLTPQVLEWQVTGAPAAQHSRLFVAEADGRIAGTARTGVHFDSSEPGQAFALIEVHPAERGRGAGSALLSAAERHLTGAGATTVRSWVNDDGHSLSFAARRGYRRCGTARYLRLDLAGAPLPPRADPPPGVELRTAADLAADPRPLYEADAEASLDEPGEVPVDAMTYETWLALVWERPNLDRDLTSVALAGGEVVSFSLAQTDRAGRYWSGMTGTRRAHRGRGLAKLVKNDSLHRARAAGCAEAFTGNDAGNAPMLAVNAWFGYVPDAVQIRCARTLGAAGGG